MRAKVVEILRGYWNDYDKHVRTVSIQLMQQLGTMDVPEMMEAFNAPNGLLQEIATLMHRENYDSKRQLEVILCWYMDKISLKK